jgi:hypothetical protein
MEFSKLERAVFDTILDRSVPGLDALRQQLAAARVVERDYTGVGFYTKIDVPRSLPPMPDTQDLRDHLFAGASGHVKSDPDVGVSFHLWTNAGYVACLEGVAFGCDSWSDEDDIEIVPTYIGRRK